MANHATLGKFLMYLRGLPSERVEVLSDLVAVLGSERKDDWNDPATQFSYRRRCEIKVNKSDLDLYLDLGSSKDKLSRMLNSVIEAMPPHVLSRLRFIMEGILKEGKSKWGRQLQNLLDSVVEAIPVQVFGRLCVIAERLASADGDQWCRELRKLLVGDTAWITINPEPSYLCFYSGLFYRETNINVYERTRTGTNKDTFQRSLRGGDLSKVCFSSENMGLWFCNHFREQLCAIPDNKVVFFLFRDHFDETFVVYADMNSEGRPATGVTYQLDLDTYKWVAEDRARRIVLTCEHR
jgi:hypothetical protein